MRAGHPWVYRSDVVRPAELPRAALLEVADEHGNLIGTALSSSASQIALRMLSATRLAEADLPALLRQRLAAAIAYRAPLVHQTDAYRLVFSEADQLPGLIVDRYHDVLSLQVLTQAFDRDDLRSVVLASLQELLAPAAIAERVDARIRQLEDLPERNPGLLAGERHETVFTMNGVRFHYDALGGQKTGAFLDQRENYAAAARYGRGRALDVFCYQGGFALHLAPVCQSVTGVDVSRPALEVAEQNALLNQLEIEWLEANAFDLLHDYAAAGERYDTIVLDPPAFAKNRRALETALRGYKELNLRALRMLKPGGVLVTCSCSHHVSEADFMEMLAAAARDSHRRLRLLEKRFQALDHPIVLSVPETAYLKCVICFVE